MRIPAERWSRSGAAEKSALLFLTGLLVAGPLLGLLGQPLGRILGQAWGKWQERTT